MLSGLWKHEIDYIWLDDGERCYCLAMCWPVWHNRTWGKWHLWLPFLHGASITRLVCYVEKSCELTLMYTFYYHTWVNISAVWLLVLGYTIHLAFSASGISIGWSSPPFGLNLLKRCQSERDNESALELFFPGICMTFIRMLYLNVDKTRFLTRDITLADLEDCYNWMVVDIEYDFLILKGIIPNVES